MSVSKVQHITGQKTGCNRSRPVFFRFFNFSTNLATGNRKISEFVQLQPVVRFFSVGFSLISVFFSVQWTGPVNISCWYLFVCNSGKKILHDSLTLSSFHSLQCPNNIENELLLEEQCFNQFSLSQPRNLSHLVQHQASQEWGSGCLWWPWMGHCNLVSSYPSFWNSYLSPFSNGLHTSRNVDCLSTVFGFVQGSQNIFLQCWAMHFLEDGHTEFFFNPSHKLLHQQMMPIGCEYFIWLPCWNGTQNSYSHLPRQFHHIPWPTKGMDGLWWSKSLLNSVDIRIKSSVEPISLLCASLNSLVFMLHFSPPPSHELGCCFSNIRILIPHSNIWKGRRLSTSTTSH